MTEKKTAIIRVATLLLALTLAAQVLGVSVFADDAELLKELPGEWILSEDIRAAEEEVRTANRMFLTLEENGLLSLRCLGEDGEYAYSCEGAWAFELINDYSPEYGLQDRLTLAFTSTDDARYAGSGYHAEYVYCVYSESWTENDTLYTYLILTPVDGEGVSPFEDLTGFNDAALHREQGPNMRVVKCGSFVSLRERHSTSSARLAKVPLGALVFAFTEEGETNGFIRCVYQDEYGYILSEYLEPID